MKKIYTLLFLFFMIFFLGASAQLKAQDTLDISPFNDDGEFNFIPTLWGDTTETGERANLDRVYRLQRGQVYIMDQTIFADYPIRLVAENENLDKHPPILIRGKYTTGANIKTYFTFSGSNLEHSFTNIVFNGVDIDRTYFGEWNRGLKIAGDNIVLNMNGCIMNAWAGLFLEVEGDNASLYVRDCTWRNGVGGQAPPWGAQQNVVVSKQLNNVVFTNNSFFNTGGFWLFQEDGIANSLIVEHNTLFTSCIDLVRMRDMVNAKFRSNLFYGTHAYGQSESERTANWFDKDMEYISMFSLKATDIGVMSGAGLTEADKKVEVTHNSYFSPQALTDWWTSYGGLNTPVWMNERTLGMFSDKDAYPLLKASNNLEMDPQFTDTDMETWVVDEVINYCDKVRRKKTTPNRNYEDHLEFGDLIRIPWPLPESLVYSNETMLSGGHDGLPVGDLNWYPSKRAEYTENYNGVINLNGHKNLNLLKQNIPNPAKGWTNIDFEVPNKMNVKLQLFDKEGRLIKVLLEEEMTTGHKTYKCNVSDLNSGLYFYTISTDNYTESRKMIVIK